MSEVSPDVRRFVDLLRRLSRRPELAEQLMEEASSEQARADLGVEPELATELKSVLLAMRSSASHTTPETRTENAPVSVGLQEARKSVSTSQEFLDSSFNQLKWAYRISLAMSSVVFVVGLGFLVIAAVRTFTHPESVSSTAVIGGLGIVQIVALFYRNPLRDIGHAVSNAQQSKMAVMTYMLGVNLVGESVYGGKPTAEALDQLSALTERALQQMEHYTENHKEPGQDVGKDAET